MVVLAPSFQPVVGHRHVVGKSKRFRRLAVAAAVQQHSQPPQQQQQQQQEHQGSCVRSLQQQVAVVQVGITCGRPVGADQHWSSTGDCREQSQAGKQDTADAAETQHAACAAMLLEKPWIACWQRSLHLHTAVIQLYIPVAVYATVYSHWYGQLQQPTLGAL